MKSPPLTVVRSPPPGAEFVCPRCGTETRREALVEAGYLCPSCRTVMAHLDLLPNGNVRGVFGWLRSMGEVVNARYRIEHLLGRGGFGATYLVSDLHLGVRRRALKEVPSALDDGEEARILTVLRHRAIPDILDRFEAAGVVSMVLEFGGDRTLEGERRQCGGRLPVDRVMRWAFELCDVLEHLHRQEPPITHRDLKPENILLGADDNVMLVDFGIAKEAIGDAVTRTVARCASHGFSPPEQILGTGTDQRSDLYSLAATLYTLLTGEVPRPAHERVAGQPLLPPRSLCPSIPEPLEEALLQALELNLNHRPQSVDELRRSLTRGPRESNGLVGSIRALSSRTVRVTRRRPLPDAIGYTGRRATLRMRLLLRGTLGIIGFLAAAAILLRTLGPERGPTGPTEMPATGTPEPASPRPAKTRPVPNPTTPAVNPTGSAAGVLGMEGPGGKPIPTPTPKGWSVAPEPTSRPLS